MLGWLSIANILPRKAGEGDHAKRGGGGCHRSDMRQFRLLPNDLNGSGGSPLHHPSDGAPPPLRGGGFARHDRSRLAVIALGWAFSPLAALPAHAYEVFVTNERDNTVTVFDSKTYLVTRTFHVGQRPRGLIFSKDGKKLFVCASDSDAVQVIDPDAGKMIENLPSGEDPEQFTLAPDGHTLYIANENNAATTVLDADTRRVLAQIDVGIEPEGVAVAPDNKIAVTTSETTNMVHWIDTKTFRSDDATPVGQRPREAKFSKDGKLLWVSSEVGGTVSIIDVATHKVIHTIPFAIKGITADTIQPVGITLTDDGRYAFVALGPASHVAVIDAKTYEVQRYILTGRRVWHMALTPEEDMLFTTDGVSNTVSAIDVARLKVVQSVKVGRFPWGVAVRPAAKP